MADNLRQDVLARTPASIWALTELVCCVCYPSHRKCAMRMPMLDREYSSQLRARAKRWWFFTILSVIALVCISCSGATQQTSSSGGGTVQSAHTTQGARLPLTDSVPPRGDMTPTVPVSPSQKVVSTTPTPMQPTSYGGGWFQNGWTDSADRRQGSNVWGW